MTRRRDFKRLVRGRMEQTGEPYTAALGAIREPDVPPRTAKQGELGMNDVDLQPAAASAPDEGTSIPVLPEIGVALETPFVIVCVLPVPVYTPLTSGNDVAVNIPE